MLAVIGRSPVKTGMTNGEQVTLYFHGARAGYKSQLLAKNPNVCIEGDIFHKVESTEHGITTRYESVIGFGTAEVTEGEEKVRGLRAINAHYGFADYPVERCRGLAGTAVYRITLSSLTGKRNRAV